MTPQLSLARIELGQVANSCCHISGSKEQQSNPMAAVPKNITHICSKDTLLPHGVLEATVMMVFVAVAAVTMIASGSALLTVQKWLFRHGSLDNGCGSPDHYMGRL